MTTGPITRNGKIYLFGIRQFQPVHQAYERLQAPIILQTRITGFFLGNGREEAALIVMCRIDQRLLGEGKQLVVNAAIQGSGITGLKIRPTTGIDESGIPGKQHLLSAVIQ